MLSDPVASPSEDNRGDPAAWLACLAGPLAWFVQLVGVYALTMRACSVHGRLLLHLVSLLCLLMAMGGSGLAWARWGEFGRGWPESLDAAAIGRMRLLGAVGALGGLLFAWIICVQWVAVVVLDPCPA